MWWKPSHLGQRKAIMLDKWPRVFNCWVGRTTVVTIRLMAWNAFTEVLYTTRTCGNWRRLFFTFSSNQKIWSEKWTITLIGQGFHLLLPLSRGPCHLGIFPAILNGWWNVFCWSCLLHLDIALRAFSSGTRSIVYRSGIDRLSAQGQKDEVILHDELTSAQEQFLQSQCGTNKSGRTIKRGRGGIYGGGIWMYDVYSSNT